MPPAFLLLETQYASMRAWVEYMRAQAGASPLWNTGFHFGDWLAYAAPVSEARSYPGATTGKTSSPPPSSRTPRTRA